MECIGAIYWAVAAVMVVGCRRWTGGLEWIVGLSSKSHVLPDLFYIFDCDLKEYTPECTNFSKKDCWHRNNRPRPAIISTDIPSRISDEDNAIYHAKTTHTIVFTEFVFCFHILIY